MTKQDKKFKIALVGYKLAKGGLERVFSTVSELLQESNCEVHVIVLENEIEYPYSGTILNLGNFSKFQKYFKLKKYLQNHQFDYIIDFRHRINPWMELIFLHYLYSGFQTIYTIHSSKLEVYLTSKTRIAKQILENAYRIVTVSEGINKQLKDQFSFDKGVLISNTIPLSENILETENVSLPYKYCIAIGRLVALKQFDKLIETYANSNLPAKNIHLVILGEGQELKTLIDLIEKNKLTNFIHLRGFKKSVYYYLKNAEFLVLCSKYEGFPMVVLEALNAGTPVISFDCETGPREMIINEFNGLLIENQDFDQLKNAMNQFVDDQELLQFCKENAKRSVDKFSSEKTRKKWLDLMNIKTF